ncbi:MAG: FtsW/RodA/SpoVE family cell cycle protein, partial [Pseudanabaena sp.]
LIVVQAILNVGVATGVLPTTGLPFPFLSYGGSTTLSCLFIAGLLIRSAREMASAEVIPFARGKGKNDLNTKRQDKLGTRSQFS